jgi:hypothetical protein
MQILCGSQKGTPRKPGIKRGFWEPECDEFVDLERKRSATFFGRNAIKGVEDDWS